MMLTSETEVISLATIIVRSVYTIMDYMLHNVAFEGGKCPSWPELRPTCRITEVKPALPLHAQSYPSNMIIA